MDEVQLGEKLQDERIKLGYSQEEVSRMTNLSRNTIINLENGKGSSIKTFLLYTDILKLNHIFENLGLSDEPSPMRKLAIMQGYTKRPQRVSKKNV
ncbi:MAG: helix-turn-helix domain-containing protein [Bifidobacteriaceae bacterium]|jgi:transcriptional regulator with XRE-family HTH domain|nr:helix-turn-helix domain-containing protein [Bifidobacteriaceae bacterium]